VVVGYGLVIINTVLFTHLAEVSYLVQQSGVVWDGKLVMGWATQYRLAVLSFSLVFFFISIFVYFLLPGKNEIIPDGFLFRFALLVFLLCKLPLMLSFTFYFVVWHSVLSLSNIIGYLRKNKRYTYVTIAKKIGIYSTLAITGVLVAGMINFLFTNRQGIMLYVFAGLAVLTVPHIQVMHDMYNRMRVSKEIKNQEHKT
jgi:beta-carotene 15,15'-dioxygenase